MQSLLITLLASETFRRVLAKPPFVIVILALLALTVINESAELWLDHLAPISAHQTPAL